VRRPLGVSFFMALMIGELGGWEKRNGKGEEERNRGIEVMKMCVTL
jgi:hypothetical protein